MKRIFVSAGHSDQSPGAVRNGVTEEQTMQQLRNAVTDKLRARGASVLNDGDYGQNLPLSTAIRLAKTCHGPRCELHLNAVENELARGVETFALPENKTLAQELSAAIADVLDAPLRGDKGYKEQGESQHNKLGFVAAGGVLVEVCFLSNKNEFNTYVQRQDLVAEAIAAVLLKYAAE